MMWARHANASTLGVYTWESDSQMARISSHRRKTSAGFFIAKQILSYFKVRKNFFVSIGKLRIKDSLFVKILLAVRKMLIVGHGIVHVSLPVGEVVPVGGGDGCYGGADGGKPGV